MKSIINKISFLILLVGIFSFTNIKSERSSINLDDIDVIETLSMEEFQCRPSAEFMFFVDTDVVKKYRGYSIVTANIFVLNRKSGSKLNLASENFIIHNNYDSVIQLENFKEGFDKTILSNGDFSISRKSNTPFLFKELINYTGIYNSYINSSNKLLNLNRGKI